MVTESQLREEIYLSFPNIQFIFETVKLSRDFIREIINQLSEKDRYYLEKEMVECATIVRVLTNEYLQNCITYLEDKQVDWFKSTLEQLHALEKFKYRLSWQQTEQYKMLHLNRKTATLMENF